MEKYVADRKKTHFNSGLQLADSDPMTEIGRSSLAGLLSRRNTASHRCIC